MRTKLILLLLIVINLIPLTVVHAQDGGSIQATVAVSSLNVRAEPSTTREIVGTLTQDTIVTVYGSEVLKNNGGVWVYISADGLAGWVLSEYLTFPAGINRGELPIYYGLDIPQYTFIAQASQREDLPLYAEPTTIAATLALVPSGSLMAVQVTPDAATDDWGYIRYENGFVYVTWLKGGASGWFLADRIHYPYAYRRIGSNSGIAFYEPYPFQPDDVPLEGIPVQGQVIGYLRNYHIGSPVGVRQFPQISSNETIITLIPTRYNTWCIVHGRTTSDWIYVTLVNDTTISGWVPRPSLTLPYGYRTNFLPILEPVENPELLPSVEALSSLDTIATIPLEIYPAPTIWYDRNFTPNVIPAYAPFTVVGIHIESRMYKVVYEGGSGWINGRRYPQLTHDWFRLPVLG